MVAAFMSTSPLMPSLFGPRLALILGLICLAPGALREAGGETMAFEMVGADHYRCTNWRASDGLPSSTVEAIVQGPDGCLWIGTTRGLVRFDGHSFLPPPRELAAALDVSALLWDRLGQLWVAHGLRGIARLTCWQPQTCTKLEIPLLAPTQTPGTAEVLDEVRGGEDDESLRVVIRDIFEDNEKRIWLSTTRGVRRVESNARGSYKPSPDVSSQSPVWGVRKAPDGRLWAAQKEGLALWTRDAFLPSSIMPRSPVASVSFNATGGMWVLPLSDAQPIEYIVGEQRSAWQWPMIRGDNRMLLLATNGDVWAVNDEQGALLIPQGGGPVLTFTRHNVLPSERLLCIAQDSTGSIWLGTADAGLCQLRIVPARTFSTATHEDMPDSQVTSLAVDHSGIVWASFTPTGMVQISPAGEVQRLEALDAASFTALAPHSKMGVWGAAAVDGRFAIRHLTQQGNETVVPDPEAKAKGSVRRLLEDDAGNLWAVSSNSGTWRLPVNGSAWHNVLPQARARFISALQQHRDGRLWLVTGGPSLGLISKEAKRLPETANLHIIGERRWLHGFCETIDGTTWACQAGDSLWSQRGNSAPAILTREQGMPSDLMVQTQADTRGLLWLQTLPESIYFAPLKEMRDAAARERSSVSFRSLTRSDGVQAAPAGISQATSATDNQGRLWFTADRSLVMVDSAVASRDIPRPLPWVEKVTADGVDYPTCEQLPSQPFKLAAGTRSFTIHFTGIGLAEPSRVRCKYRLRGVDSDWSATTAKHDVSYLCPAPGPYDFEVLATHEGEAWPLLPAVLHLQVQPALWQRSWFISILSGAVLALIIAGLHYRRLSISNRLLAHEQQLYDERSRIARDLHDHLGASISSLRISVAATRQHLLQPAELTAHLVGIEAQMQASALQVDETIWLTNPNNDTLDAFCSYVVEYAQEFCNQTSTECICELPGDLPERTLAGNVRHHLLSILKEALSNSVQHGKAKQIELQLAVTETHLTMIITDNGKPKDPLLAKSQLGGNGLKNMRARAEELGGTFDIGPHEKQGIRVKVVVPL